RSTGGCASSAWARPSWCASTGPSTRPRSTSGRRRRTPRRPAMTHKTIRIGALSRVEGEGGLRVRARDGRITELELTIYEPPRFFEALLRGRAHTEPPDITARICGICPIAYQMSACQAIEAACGAEVTGPLRDL